MLLEISPKFIVDKFATIIRTKNFYLVGKLSQNHSMKGLKRRESFIFGFQLVEPCHSGAVVNKNYKPTVT